MGDLRQVNSTAGVRPVWSMWPLRSPQLALRAVSFWPPYLLRGSAMVRLSRWAPPCGDILTACSISYAVQAQSLQPKQHSPDSGLSSMHTLGAIIELYPRDLHILGLGLVLTAFPTPCAPLLRDVEGPVGSPPFLFFSQVHER